MKLNRLLAILLLAMLTVFSMAGCKQERFSESLNERFFKQWLARRDENEMQLKSLDAYYLDGWYYYHVKYSYISDLDTDWTDRELVYFGKGNIENYFNPNWENFGNMIKYKYAFLDAVEGGEHKSFTDEEMKEYYTEFFESRGAE